MALKQASRLLNLGTPLGGDELVLTSFTGIEGISQLFRFTLEMVSDNASIAAKEILGKNVTFSVRLGDDAPRHFNGFVSDFSAGDEDEKGRRSYRAEVVPWLWFLTRNSDCRIFQKMTAPDIIQQIFKDRGFSDFQVKLSGSHPKREYCVQHRETDFNFVSRLMEEEGIFYFFQHENGKHKLILGDRAAAYVDCAQMEVDYPWDFGGLALEDHLRSWEHKYRYLTGKFAQIDYNFETPSTKLLTNANTVVGLSGNSSLEFFDYPGVYINKGDGQPLTDVRMEQEEAGHDVVSGASLCRTFTPGGKFSVRQHRVASEKGKSYVVTNVTHTAHELKGYVTNDAEGEGYENSFTCIPDGVTFRPLRTTPKPRVQGVQTAFVVGPDGEEIYPDEYGRVKVQFHWDRYGQRNQDSSCWIRVSQVHAGKKWGGIDLPRIGEEVIVDFVDGDPDRPIIIGRVYNAEHMPPVALPAQKMVSGLKSNTYPKGGGFNQLTMDDTKGKEMLFMNSQFDKTENINHNRTTTVGVDSTEQIGNNRVTAVGVNSQEQIGSDMGLKVGNNMGIDVGSNILITAGTSITLQCGASTIHMNQAGVISISGTLVSMTGSINANVAAPITTVSGMVTLTAGILTVSEGAAVNKVDGGKTTVDGNPVKINC